MLEGGAWRNGRAVGLDWSDVQSDGGIAFATAFNLPPPYDDSIAFLSGFAADHFIEGVVFKAPGYAPAVNHEIELFVRGDISSHNARGYEVNVQSNGAYSEIVRWEGPLNMYTPLTTTGPGLGTPVNGDLIRAEVRGTVITVYKNGSFAMSATDSVFTTGNPGVGFWCRPSGTLDRYGWQSIRAGDL